MLQTFVLCKHGIKGQAQATEIQSSHSRCKYNSNLIEESFCLDHQVLKIRTSTTLFSLPVRCRIDAMSTPLCAPFDFLFPLLVVICLVSWPETIVGTAASPSSCAKTTYIVHMDRNVYLHQSILVQRIAAQS